VSKQSKPLIWLHAEVKTPPFSADARIEAGVLLRQLQDGIKLSLPHSRPMPSMGIGCHELRIQDENSTWRIVYYINSVAIVILEVFSNTTPQTPQAVLIDAKQGSKLINRFSRCAMKNDKLKRLKAAGWKMGNADNFLQLSEEESKLVAIKWSLMCAVKKSRIKRNISQIDLAQRMKSSQSRIAKIETGDSSISLDLIVHALIATGATTRDIQAAFVPQEHSRVQ
jgi:phage-related protein/DNA-binding XRE family transcriptional regulator